MEWGNPFTNLRKLEILIEYCLTEEDRQNIDMNLPCSNQTPMFHYPAYLETLNFFKLFYLVTKWIQSQPEMHDIKMRTVRKQLVCAILCSFERTGADINCPMGVVWMICCLHGPVLPHFLEE